MADAVTTARREANRWVPPAGLLATARANTWRGDPQGTISAQRPIGPGVVWLGRKMRERWGSTGAGLVTQTYARGPTLAPGGRGSMHHAGRAIDIMVAEVNGRPNRAGDEIANWLLANARDLGLQYMIWSGTQWSSATGATSVYPGGEDHFNHLHLDLSNAGAAGSLPWYANMDPALRAGSAGRDGAESGGTAVDNEASPSDGGFTVGKVLAGLAVLAGGGTLAAFVADAVRRSRR